MCELPCSSTSLLLGYDAEGEAARRRRPVACTDGSVAPLAAGLRPAPGGARRTVGPRRREISAWIERAREHGDIKENADYDAAKNEQGHNEARIRHLEELLRTAVVVEGPEGDVVAPGTIVEVRMEGDDDTTSYLVGSIEERSDDFEVLSTSSPLGQALLGHAPGRDGQLRRPAAHVRGRDRERPAASGEPRRARRSRTPPPRTTCAPSTDFLVGCMLPDLAAIARVRLTRPDGRDRARAWSSTTRATRCSTSRTGSAPSNRELRDVLGRHGRRLRRGPGVLARGGGDAARRRVGGEPGSGGRPRRSPSTRSTSGTPDLAGLAHEETQAAWVERLQLIGSSLEPARYADAGFVAERLYRMTAGRRRIELRGEHVDVVATALAEFRPSIAARAPEVVGQVRRRVPSRHLPG